MQQSGSILGIVPAPPGGDLSTREHAWRDQKRPFAFTARKDDPLLEFTIRAALKSRGAPADSVTWKT